MQKSITFNKILNEKLELIEESVSMNLYSIAAVVPINESHTKVFTDKGKSFVIETNEVLKLNDLDLLNE
jgi:hypothetical protein